MPAAPTATTSVSEALHRYGGMYGAAWRDSIQLSEMVQVAAALEVAQIAVPLAGTTKQGNKTGRETRSGTLYLQKVDTRWEMQVWSWVSKTLAQRRAARDQGDPLAMPSFQLLLEWDDPDALGIEKWQLDGCQIYRANFGFNIGDDIATNEIPFTWEDETPIYAYERKVGAGGVWTPSWFAGYGPPPKVS